MTSHEYAEKLYAVASMLNRSPEFQLPAYMDNYVEEYGVDRLLFHSHKDLFLAAVRAIGNGKKSGNGTDFEFIYSGLHLVADRSAVCRIVTPAVPAVYDCLPLLSPEEEAQIETPQVGA
jgi:hypothetical protein